MARTLRRYRGGGATWTVDCRWQVRLLDEDGEPLSPLDSRGGWRHCDTLRECREHLIANPDVAAAEIRRDGLPYGRLFWGPRAPAASPTLRRVT